MYQTGDVRMSVLYVKEQGALIHKCGERITVTKNNKQLLDIPILHVENIAVIGNVQVTTQALHILMERGVDVSYFSNSGYYLGHTAAEASKNIFLRFEQYQFYLDETKRLKMAKTIVSNKIRNQMSIIEGHRFENGYNRKNDLISMEKLLVSVNEKETTNELLGVEGMCSNIYFGAFGQMFLGKIRFEGRNRRPPKDPINIILSLAYTLLTKEVCSALDAESFEPYLGFLHGIRYGRKSLALDIVEEFRQPVVDRLVVLLFNKRMMTEFDFTDEEDGRIQLNEDGFVKFCKEYERWMTGKNAASKENSFRSKIREQITKLKRSIQKGEEYEPYSWRKEQDKTDLMINHDSQDLSEK